MPIFVIIYEHDTIYSQLSCEKKNSRPELLISDQEVNALVPSISYMMNDSVLVS